MKLNLKIIIVGLIPLILFLSFAYSYMQKNEEMQKHQKYLEETSKIRIKIKLLIKEKQEAILLISTSLSSNQNIKDALMANDNSKIKLKLFSLKLRKNSSLRNVWFQVINANGTSLYRSWTNKSGDNLLKTRSDIVKMLKQPQVISSISIGKFDMSFKSMIPIFEKNKFIGIIETIAKFNSVSNKMKDAGYNNLIIVDKRYVKQLTNPFTKMFIENYYVANYNADTQLMDLAKKNSINTYINIKNYKIDTKNNLFISVYKILDINGQDMGYFIFSKKLEDIDISDVEREQRIILFVFIVIFLSVGWMLYYFYIINYKKFIEKQNEILECSVEDKTKELKDKSEVLKYQAEHDTLTKLPNRLLFLDRLKQALRHAKRVNESVSVLFLDLDRFKEVNDTYGHEAGDKLLQSVTERLKECIREEDTVARLGGDEFTIIFKNLQQNDIIKVLDKIMHLMQTSFQIDDVELYTTFSVGISNYPDDGDTPEILLRNADTAMYKAKDGGKNNYQFYNEKMTKVISKRIELENDLRKALLNNEFVPYFQPKVDAKNMKIIGLEALIRWQHPTKGMIYPNDFISFAEEIGLIAEIDNFMMISSMKQMMLWKKDGLEVGKLSINLSVKQLSSKTYLDELKSILKEVTYDTKYLEVEITENYTINNPKKAIQLLDEIRSLGISISIDDFGTGYSSLAYLKKLPINKLKIDRSFVKDIPIDKDDIAIVKTIIALATNLDLEIIAEGAENQEQVDFLVKEGCENIQGYFFSKPLSAADFKRFVLSFS